MDVPHSRRCGGGAGLLQGMVEGRRVRDGEDIGGGVAIHGREESSILVTLLETVCVHDACVCVCVCA